MEVTSHVLRNKSFENQASYVQTSMGSGINDIKLLLKGEKAGILASGIHLYSHPPPLNNKRLHIASAYRFSWCCGVMGGGAIK